jgi:hypothetical protein
MIQPEVRCSIHGILTRNTPSAAEKPWTNLDQRKKEVETLNSLHMVNDRRNGWLEAMAKSVDNSFASMA